MSREYGTDGSASTIGSQLNTFHWQRKALIELKKEEYFGQLADVTTMPKHKGKRIKRYLYLPMLDDRNVTDQGIDTDGAVDVLTRTLEVRYPGSADGADGAGKGKRIYFTVEGADNTATAASLLASLQAQVVAWAIKSYANGGAGLNTANLTGTDAQNYTELSTTGDESAYDKGFRFVVHDAVPRRGNLYGSSKDVGTITARMPKLGEHGGRVNRVGFKRVELEGTLHKYGYFDEYTQESVDFDTDDQLMMHVNREMLRGASEITEDLLQIDLLNSAGVVYYGGDASSNGTMTGEDADTKSLITYADLQRLDIELNNNRCPKNTKIITGTRLTDTKTVPNARYMYIGSELQTVFEDMKDQFNNPAFISIEKYAAGTTLANGEIGMVGKFRLIVVPEMMHWAGKGKSVTTNGGYRETNGKYDIFPALVVGSESFTTIGFQTSNSKGKFTIYHKKPGLGVADKNDPYGETGFMSIKWWYGFMVWRSERIALVKSVAPF